MIYMLLAMGFNVALTFALRFSEKQGGNVYGVLTFNYLCGAIIGLIQVGFRPLAPGEGLAMTAAMSLLNGALYVSALYFMTKSTLINGAALTSTFNRLGVVIPTLGSVLFFGEIPGTLQWLGLGLVLLSFVVLNGGEGGQGRGNLNLLLILIFVLGGSTDLLSKFFTTYGNLAHENHYILYTFLAAGTMAVGLFLREGKPLRKKDVLLGLMVGIPNQLTSLLLLKAVPRLPAYFLFPAYAGGIILLVNLVGMALGERGNRHQYLATAIIFVALILLNL
ncbi:MAG: hypothetical protein Q4E76_05245 [Tissierellia bacterium]|nr:hypothetical protein [Tissierellia bacterium]